MFNKREAVCLSEGVGEVDGASEGSGSSIASSLSTFTQQVAGHKGENQMLLDESGRSIFKPLNSNEALFYRTLNDAIGKDSTFPAHFFPTFMGTTAHNGRGSLSFRSSFFLFRCRWRAPLTALSRVHSTGESDLRDEGALRVRPQDGGQLERCSLFPPRTCRMTLTRIPFLQERILMQDS